MLCLNCIENIDVMWSWLWIVPSFQPFSQAFLFVVLLKSSATNFSIDTQCYSSSWENIFNDLKVKVDSQSVNQYEITIIAFHTKVMKTSMGRPNQSSWCTQSTSSTTLSAKVSSRPSSHRKSGRHFHWMMTRLMQAFSRLLSWTWMQLCGQRMKYLHHCISRTSMSTWASQTRQRPCKCPCPCQMICSYLWFIALFQISRRMVTSVAPHLVFLGFPGKITGTSYTLANNVTFLFCHNFRTCHLKWCDVMWYFILSLTWSLDPTDSHKVKWVHHIINVQQNRLF